jgi:hypothetical protein
MIKYRLPFIRFSLLDELSKNSLKDAYCQFGQSAILPLMTFLRSIEYPNPCKFQAEKSILNSNIS